MATRSLPLILIALLFLASAYIASAYAEPLARLLGSSGVSGILIYMAVATVSTVVAPLSSIVLLPIVSAVWGPFMAAVASIIAWFVGAMIAFYLSRRYGRPLVERFVSKERLAAVERRIPSERLFWQLVALRMVVPVDVLSYILGLFKNITWKTYAFSTLLGIIPFAFVFAYVGTLPLQYTIPLVLVALGAVLLRRKEIEE
jgi:uncharacterized membrane protein YdjX (TVP38/TMEM64 family)